MKNKPHVLKNKKGQAVLEYVLVLFVIVSIFLGILLTFAGATQKFMENYYGAYFRCLLETGELPQLGGENSDTSECNSEFQPFTLEEGRPPVISSLDGGLGGSEDSDASKDSGGSSGAGSEVSAVRSYVPMGGLDGSGSSENLKASKVPIAKSKNTLSLGDPLAGSRTYDSTDAEGDEGIGRSTYVPMGGKRLVEEEEGSDGKTIVAAKEEDGVDLRDQKRVPAKIEEKKNIVEEDVSLGLPDIMRYILIAAMLIALIVFLGGQVLQYQKSKDG